MLFAADLIAALLLFVLIGEIEFGDAAWETVWAAMHVNVWIGAGVYALAWAATLWALGSYAFAVRMRLAVELRHILAASFIVAFGTMAFLFLVRLDVSRLFVVVLLAAQPVVTIAERLMLRRFLERLRARGDNHCQMIVLGIHAEAQAFADAVESHPELGIEVIGHLRGHGEIESAVTRPILGDGDDLARIFHERVVDEVAVCVAPRAVEWAAPLIRLAAEEGKHVRVPSRLPIPEVGLPTEELDGWLVRSHVNSPAHLLSLAVKRFLDLFGAALGLVVLSPVFLLVGVAIRIRDGRPVLFNQARVGLHGRPFILHKFRTMDRDAEARYEDLAASSDTKGAAFTMRHDPRVTPLGAILRRSSLDELPQLWNVLKGSMSFIGPRPAPPREVAAYDIWHRRRLSMRPGITGLSQVRTRLDGHFDDRAHLDLAYIDNWSLASDARIMGRTFSAVLRWMRRQPGA